MNSSIKVSTEPSRFVKSLTGFLVVAAAAGFVRFGGIPVVVAGLLAWPFAKWASQKLELHLRSKAMQLLIGLVLVIATLFLSTIAGLLASKAVPQSSITQLSSAAPAEQSSSLTESQLVTFAIEQNKNNPTKISEHVELTRIDAGPGLHLTYHVRILAESASFTDADLDSVRTEAVQEACSLFKPGLSAGVTYLMSYTDSSGASLLTVPIDNSDCGNAP